MPNVSPAEQLRRQIANVLQNEKAHEVPTICGRYGMADGTGDEAFSGKFRYVMKRLHSLETAEVLRIGRSVQADYQDRSLGEAIAIIEDHSQPKITGLTRRRLMQAMEHWKLEGDLDIIEFLEPVLDLDDCSPTYNESDKTDFRTPKMRDAIWRHCINNYDWDNADLLKYIGFLICHQRQLFRLLERLVDPEIRTEESQESLVATLNEILTRDGFALRVNGTLSGSNIYKVGSAGAPGATPADKEISEVMVRFDEAGINDLWQKALLRRHTDPNGAITVARTFLEQTCKHILDEEGVAYPDDVDLPKLWSLCAKQVNLAPSQHTEEAFKGILGSCQNVVNTLGTIRNRIGDSHGQRGRPVRAKPRHAQLAVNLAGSMATFLLATWEDQKAAAEKGSKPRRTQQPPAVAADPSVQ